MIWANIACQGQSRLAVRSALYRACEVKYPKLETSIKWILPTKDRALNPKQQRVYMNNIGNIKSIIKLTAPHDVMISHPEEVAKILLEN